MLKILLHRFFRDIATAPRAVSGRPEVIAPISFGQMRKLLLQPPRRTTFQSLEQICQSQARRIFDVHMNVVFADYAFQYPYVFGIADLNQQVATSRFDVALKDVVTILCYPDNMRSQSAPRVRAFSVLDVCIFRSSHVEFSGKILKVLLLEVQGFRPACFKE